MPRIAQNTTSSAAHSPSHWENAPSILPDLFRSNLETLEHSTALCFEDSRLSYHELNERSNQLARRLQSLGVGPDVLVAVVADRSMEMVIAMVAILKAGGAYVPIDPGYPDDRLLFMIEDCGAPVVLLQEKWRQKIKWSSQVLVFLDGLPEWHTESSQPVSSENLTPDHLAYVIYTSGTSGRPKGVMISHRAICNRLIWMQVRYDLKPEDAVLQKTPFSFDVSVWEFFWPLMIGARLVLARPEGHKDADYLAHLIEQHEIRVCHFVPSMLHSFLKKPERTEQCRSLRHVICSGEVLSRSVHDRFFTLLDHVQLHNLYGPTEAAVDVTHWTCQKNWPELSIPIGVPVSNTQIYILNAAGEPVKNGAVGELHIGGVQVGRGYLGREELTAKYFVPDPFAKQSSTTRSAGNELTEPGTSYMYKSGDLARWRSDANIDFLGRIDNQVKILGMRIELGEIEAVLEEMPEISQAAVLAREDIAGEHRLVAYVVASQGYETSVSMHVLRPYLKRRLPDYMLPSALVVLPVMPISANGKTDRKALPTPSRQRPDLGYPYVPPATDLERHLTDLWSNLLRIDGIGVQDPFFDLGGNSILAAEFVSKIATEFAVNIYIVSIFDSPTIREYSQFLEKDYPESVLQKYKKGTATLSVTGSSTTITDHDVEDMHAAVYKLTEPAPPESGGKSSRPAIFVLAPPRSGTTLLRVMLAGHPQLFAAAELQLLCFHTLEERRKAFSGKFSLWLEGTIRAIMELRKYGADKAQNLMEQYESQQLTTRQFYQHLQFWAGERILVDKSPSYVLDSNALQKAEQDFEQPLYIHLVRHPYAMAKSFQNYHMDQVLFLKQHSFSPLQLAELVWLVSHETTVEFLKNVPSHRWVRIHYEELVRSPEPVLRNVCKTLNISYHDDMATPYMNIESKMVDGIHKVSKPMGDTHFLMHDRIDPKVADNWKGVLSDNFLSDRTWKLAESLGYKRPNALAVNTSRRQRRDVQQLRHNQALKARRVHRQKDS